MLSNLTLTGVFLSSRVKKENIGLFLEEESPGAITGVRGEGGGELSGIAEGLCISGYSTGTE